MGIIADDTEVDYPTVGLEPVNMEKVEFAARVIRGLIDNENEETIGGDLSVINDSLNNDERIALATNLKEDGPGGTTRKTYVSIYNEWLRIYRNEHI